MPTFLVLWGTLSVVVAFVLAQVMGDTYDLDRDVFRSAARAA